MGRRQQTESKRRLQAVRQGRFESPYKKERRRSEKTFKNNFARFGDVDLKRLPKIGESAECFDLLSMLKFERRIMFAAARTCSAACEVQQRNGSPDG